MVSAGGPAYVFTIFSLATEVVVESELDEFDELEHEDNASAAANVRAIVKRW